MSKSMSTPANKPLKHGAGYNRSTRFVSNVARVIPRFPGVAHCSNLAYKDSCPNLYCNSAKETI